MREKNDGTCFFSIICPFELLCSPGVLIELSCSLVTVDLDVEVNLSVGLLTAFGNNFNLKVFKNEGSITWATLTK